MEIDDLPIYCFVGLKLLILCYQKFCFKLFFIFFHFFRFTFFSYICTLLFIIMNFIKRLLSICKPEERVDIDMKYLVVGLGNCGEEYAETRHNCGFMVVDALAKEAETTWTLDRHAYRSEMRLKGKQITLIKPTTYMNLSGKAVNYWLGKEKVPLENLLVVVDDIALPVGTLRMKKQGSHGGHNGLRNIEELLGTNAYCRLRVGVGAEFSRGKQIDYVLGKFSSEESAKMEPCFAEAVEIVKCFVTQGPDRAMNLHNHK